MVSMTLERRCRQRRYNSCDVNETADIYEELAGLFLEDDHCWNLGRMSDAGSHEF
jgi:hypothetical protein